MLETKFLTETSFQLQIEQCVIDKKITHLEAVLLFCEENDVEYESLKKIITSNLKDKIKLDAQEVGLMRKESKLPI